MATEQTILTPQQAEDEQGRAAYLRAMAGPQAKRILAVLWEWPIEKLERMVAEMEKRQNV